jgi:hypothetical protein
MRKKFFFLGILLGVCLASPAQFYSARTNLIGLATGNINLEGSMTLNRRWSLHLPVQYNPFVFKDNRQFRNLPASAELLQREELAQGILRPRTSIVVRSE